MTRTTPAPPFDVASLWPELAGSRRTTVRLHPRRDPEVGVDQSSLGGPMRWPDAEPWPDCSLPHEHYGELGAPMPEPGSRYVPVLQLFRSDVPELPFPSGADVFQLLWCPNDHSETYSVLCRAQWWPREVLTGGRVPLTATVHLDGYVPNPCAVHPERVDEYPGYGDLPPDVEPRVGAWEMDVDEPAYQWLLSTAPGSKVGGHPHWFQDPQWPACPAGHTMEHLLTVSDHEFDGGTWKRWMPIEESGTWDGPPRERLRIQEPADLRLGMASIYVFLCRECPDWPIETVYQR
jgi:hypothetical protein